MSNRQFGIRGALALSTSSLALLALGQGASAQTTITSSTSLASNVVSQVTVQNAAVLTVTSGTANTANAGQPAINIQSGSASIQSGATITAATGAEAIRVAASQALTNLAGGVVTGVAGQAAVTLANTATPTTATTLTNGGTIQNTGAGGVGVSATGGVTISNSGLINAAGSAISVTTTTGTTATSITNTGSIVSTDAAGIAVGAGSVNITNTSGRIAGTVAGIQVGTSVTATTITNSGTIEGTAGPGIQGLAGTLTVTNNATGRILGTTAGIMVSGVTATTVTNSGSIVGSAGPGILIGSGTATITNNAGGVIRGTTAGIRVTTSATSATITNAGTIEGTAGPGIDASTATALGSLSITNNAGGLIRGTTAGVLVSGVTSTTITNAATGTITGTAGPGVDVRSGTLSLTNSGLISGTTAGLNVATGVTSATITNNAGGTIIGSAGPGVIFGATAGSITNAGLIQGSTHGVQVLTGATASTITNSGTIIGGTGAGVQIEGRVTTLTNTGLIRTSSSTVGAVTIVNGATLSTLTNSGTIIGGGGTAGTGVAIDNQGSAALTINNSGSIGGDIKFGTGADTLNVTGGAITGAVVGRTGTAQRVDFALGSTGTFSTAGSISNVATVGVTSGRVTLNNAVSGATAFNVASGSSLIMNGTAASVGATTFTNAGTVNANAFHTVTGNYSQTGQLAATINSTNAPVSTTATTYNIGLNVSGTATFGTGASLAAVVDANRGLSGTDSFRILQAGSISGTVPTTATTTLSNGLTSIVTLTPVREGNSVFLRPRAINLLNDATINSVATSGSPAAQALIRLLNRIPSGSNAQIDELVRLLTIAQGRLSFGLLNALFVGLAPSVEMNQGGSSSANALSGSTSGAISNRVSQLRQFEEEGVAAGNNFGRVSVWMQGFGTGGHQGRRSGQDGYNSIGGGVVIGADSAVTDRVTVGAAFTYGSANIKGTGNRAGSKTDVQSYQLSLYASYNPNPWYAEGSFTYSRNNFDISKNLNTSVLPGNTLATRSTADYDGNQYTVRVGGGYNAKVQDYTVTPNAFLQYSSQNQDGYTERGAGGLGSTVQKTSRDDTQLGIGVRVQRPLQLEQGRLIPEARLYYIRSFNTDAQNTIAGFSGAPQFLENFQGPKPNVNNFNLGLGATYQFSDKLSLSAQYDLYFNESFTGHTGFVRLRYNF
jgi:outer membrane autotransporter protein